MPGSESARHQTYHSHSPERQRRYNPTIHRSESNRSDRSDVSTAYNSSSEGGSSKKVSFNNAVRVKKYSTPPIIPIDIPENKFWFKVYKTQQHQYKPTSSDSNATQLDESSNEHTCEKLNSESHNECDEKRLSIIVENCDSRSGSASGTSTLTPEMSRKSDYMINKTSLKNSEDKKYYGTRHYDELQAKRKAREASANRSDQQQPIHMPIADQNRNYVLIPDEPEIDYMSSEWQANQAKKDKQRAATKTSKSNPLMNGVKVIFGMSPKIPNKAKSETNSKLEQIQAQQVRELENDNHQRSDAVEQAHAYEASKKQTPSNMYSAPSRTANLVQNYKLYDSGMKSDNNVVDLNGRSRYDRFGRSSNSGRARSSSPSTVDGHMSDNNNRALALRNDIHDMDTTQRNGSNLVSAQVWKSGPMLVADRTDYENSLVEMPGEGKIFTKKEEGTKIWKTKTRRRHVETVVKEPKDGRERSRERSSKRSDSNENVSRIIKAIEYDDGFDKYGEKRKSDNGKMISVATDDEKMVSANELDEIFLKKKKSSDLNVGKSERTSNTWVKSIDAEPAIDKSQVIPMVRDVGIQCNRKKTDKHLTREIRDSSSDPAYRRVIKSTNNGLVSAYSDVPSLRAQSPSSQRKNNSKYEMYKDNLAISPSKSEVIYSQIDKSKKKLHKDEYFDERTDVKEHTQHIQPKIITATPVNHQRGLSPTRYQESIYSSSPEKTITLKNKTKGFGFNVSSGLNDMGPIVNKLPAHSRSPTLSRSTKSKTTNYELPDDSFSHLSDQRRNDGIGSANYGNNNNNHGYRKEVKQEVLEETISISNASSDDMMIHNQNTDIDEFIAPKSMIRELDHKRKEISYENVSPTQRQLANRDVYDGVTSNGSGLWLRDVDEDYRRGMAQSEVALPSSSGHVHEPSYSTLSRLDYKNKQRDFTPPPRQAFTLDRRHLKDRNNSNNSYNYATDSASELKTRTIGRPMKQITHRFSRSDANLAHSHSDYEPSSSYHPGLTTSYQTRPGQRAASLNRINTRGMSPSSNTRSYLKGRLGSAGNSAHSSSDSDTHAKLKAHRHYVHDREPIVMYIPAVSHHEKRADDDIDRLSGILRSQSVASSNARKPPKHKKGKTSASSDIGVSNHHHAHLNGRPSEVTYVTSNPIGDEELDEIVELRDPKEYQKGKKGKKNGLDRRHSIPKDTKFTWLQKLKFRVRNKEP